MVLAASGAGMSAKARTADVHNPGDGRRLIMAALNPLAAFILPWIFRDSFKPFAWIGGLRCGLASLVFSTLVIGWFFIPNRYSFIIEQPSYAFTLFVFASMGVLFSFTIERLRKANRTLRVISECNQGLVHATAEAELLQSICRIVVDPGGYRMAWVGFAKQDAAETLRP